MAHLQTTRPGSESPGYYITVEDTGTQTTDEDFILLEQTRDATTQTTDQDFILLEQTRNRTILTSEANFDFLNEINSKRNLPDTSEKPEPKCKRKNTSENSIMNDCEKHSQSRHEIFEINKQVIPTFSDKGSANPDSCMDIARASASKIESDNHCFIGINPEKTNMEDAHSHNPSIQTLNILDSVKKSTIVQNTVSNMKSSETKKLPITISDPVSSTENISFANNSAVPGSSSSKENMPDSNLCIDVFPSTSSFNQQAGVETEKKVPVCSFCYTYISKHLELFDGNNLYKCCKCTYKCYREDGFLMHIFYHPEEPLHCQICDVFYLEPRLHGILQTCNVCKIIFQCRNLLEDHYITHERYHLHYCRICTFEIAKHVIERNSKIFYHCCNCTYGADTIPRLRKHLYIHSVIRLFKCDQCGKRFRQKENLYPHCIIHRRCYKCWEEFTDEYALYEHYLKH